VSDQFGASVAISGDTVVVAAPFDDIGTNGDQGSAYVFVKPGTGWSGTLNETAKLTASDGAAFDQFGRSVAISDGTVLVGVFGGDIGPNLDQGSAYVFEFVSDVSVTIDIKPGNVPNSINPESKGKIPVAILSSATFDAPIQVDQGSLTFGRTGDEPSLAFCNSNGEDVNGDSLLDLVCHFHTQTAAFQAGDTQGILKGMTMSGTPLMGTDSVRTVP